MLSCARRIRIFTSCAYICGSAWVFLVLSYHIHFIIHARSHPCIRWGVLDHPSTSLTQTILSAPLACSFSDPGPIEHAQRNPQPNQIPAAFRMCLRRCFQERACGDVFAPCLRTVHCTLAHCHQRRSFSKVYPVPLHDWQWKWNKKNDTERMYADW